METIQIKADSPIWCSPLQWAEKIVLEIDKTFETHGRAQWLPVKCLL